MNITDKDIKQFGLNIDKSLKDLSNKRAEQDLNKNGNWFDNATKLGVVASIFEGRTLANFEVCQEDQKFMDMIDSNMHLHATELAKKLIDYANEELR